MKWKDFVFLPGMIITLVGVIVLLVGTMVPFSSLFLNIGLALLGISVIVHILLVRQRLHEAAEKSDNGVVIPAGTVHKLRSEATGNYEDGLVRTSGESITFLHYSFPFFTSARVVPFDDIDHIDVKRPTIMNGKWRIGGTGGFRTWFPLDWNRPSRDRIFFATLKTGRMKIGFTVERPDEILRILKKKGLMGTDEVTASIIDS